MEKTTIKSPIKKNQLTFYYQIERMNSKKGPNSKKDRKQHGWEKNRKV